MTDPASTTLAPQFDPTAIEPKWAQKWRSEPFRADASSGKEPFTIVIPPPNVTGSSNRWRTSSSG